MIVGLDLETTGLNPKDDHVIEVAIVHFDGNKIHKSWSSLVKPPIPIPAFTTHLTGITNEMVANAPTLEELKDEILELLGDHPIMGHFIFFDTNFLKTKGFELPNLTLDSCPLSQVLLPNEPSYSLEVLTHKLQISQPDAHRALDDVKANIELVWQLLDHFRALNPDQKAGIQAILEHAEWNWTPYVQTALKEDGGQLIKDTLLTKRQSEKAHIDWSKEEFPTPPFLVENPSLSELDLLNYALELEGDSLLALPDIDRLDEDEQTGKLREPESYLDEERFKTFCSRDVLYPLETQLAIKVELWRHETELGDKEELRLVKEEKDLWNQIACQRGETTSFYKKALEHGEHKKVLIISHRNLLIDRMSQSPMLPARQNLVVGNTEELSKSIEYHWRISIREAELLQDLHEIRQENPNHEEVLDHLAAKVSIFYGFLGMFLQHHGEEGDRRHPLIVQGDAVNGKEWTQVQKSTQSILNALNALGEELQVSPALDRFSKNIVYLEKTVHNQSGRLLWLSEDRDQNPIINSFPKNPQSWFEKRVWKADEETHLFAHKADLGDDFAFLERELGLAESFKTESSSQIQALPVQKLKNKIPSPNEPQNTGAVVKELTPHLEKKDGDIFLLTTSSHSAESFFYALKGACKEADRDLFVQFLSGGLGKIHQMRQKSDKAALFVGNEGLLNFLRDKDHPLELLAVHRLPFSRPDHPIQKARCSGLKNAYKEFTLPQTALRFHKNLHTFLGANWEDKKILILDPRAKDYGRLFI